HPLRVLSRCARQLEGLCSFLQLSSCPERLLVRFCSWLLALAPDLSYASAAILAEQLFLVRVSVLALLPARPPSPAASYPASRSCLKVLALTQPPSRHLMAALASFCSKYALPFCRILVAPILQEPAGGPEQTKLLCELVEECLEPEHVALVLSQVLEVPLSERLLPVVQAVLARQVREALPAELLELLVLALCRQAPALAASLCYAKLLTALLTLHQSRVS
ncbi:FANCE protein, partial [Nothoprocta ornata]|nr:FANCE protein [Nothoprocta ornata]